LSTLYAESSAVLRWLLGADDGLALQETMARADAVVTSALTSAEVARTLRRLAVTGVIDRDGEDDCRGRYAAASERWFFYAVTDRVLARVGQPFPGEPLRTLDAIHLATAMLYSLDVSSPIVLSVDRQVRANAQALGLAVTPRQA
jgi:predicted nucleic acid-binding protein